MVKAGTVVRVAAADVLGIEEGQGPPQGSVAHDVYAALRPFVRVVGIYDEELVLDEVCNRINAARQNVWIWSPWVGRHSTDLRNSLAAAHARGVRVRVVALPEGEVNEKLQQSLAGLRQHVPSTFLLHNMHQKIVVIDDRWTFVGSMNLLSHAKLVSQRRHDVMVQLDSPRFAKDILNFELATALAQPPTCRSCGTAMIEIQLQGHQPRRHWSWLCGNPAGQWTLPVPTAIP